MNRETQWWRVFFTGPWSAIQALGYPRRQTQLEVDFLVSALALDDADRVLDIACGVGRHSIELARRGYDATGIDFSKSALAMAGRSASEAGVQPSFVELDMRQLEERESYDAAFSFFSSFGYFSDEENLDVATRFAVALKPGGRLLIDKLVTESVLPVFRERHWSWADEARSIRVINENTWEPIAGRIETKWTFVHDDSRVEAAHSSFRLYSYRELHALLKTAGFCGLRGLATGTDEPFGLGAPRLSLIARKAEGQGKVGL